jgi:heat shock protein HtpX
MNLFLGTIGSLVLIFAFWLWRFSSVKRLWKSLGAQPAGHDPVWRQVSERLEMVAQRYRVPRPSLLLLPEFSPNALVVRSFSGRVQIALSEGLVRVVNAEELEAVLGLCLAHGYRRNRALHTCLALAFLPFASLLQSYPAIVQLVLAPWVTGVLRLAAGPVRVLESDRFAAQKLDPLQIAAVLQKLSILGRKVPMRHWNFALDSLFLLSPLTLDGGPFWVFLSQPSVEERRKNLLGKLACESAATLP